jgi:hypothetical protein
VTPVDVYLEVGAKRTFAGALAWPGWCRSGRDEQAALQALFESGPRYQQALRQTGLGFKAPGRMSDLRVVERLHGNATTDFGAPAIAPTADEAPLSDADLRRFERVLQACWEALDAAVARAVGKELSKGPRGGGRALDAIVEHVLGADAAYLSKVGWKVARAGQADTSQRLKQARAGILEALTVSAQGRTAKRGPRGGPRWTPRYFVRRVAWHALAHAWEIERRLG